MILHTRSKWILGAFVLGAIGTTAAIISSRSSNAGEVGALTATTTILNKQLIASQIGTFVQANEFPSQVDLKVDGEDVKASVTYSIDHPLQERMEKLLGTFKPDYGAFVAIDAKTGRIMSMASYSQAEAGKNLALRATFPAASIFKIVTAGAAIDRKKASPETVVPFNGGNYTLYRRNVQDNSRNRWTRYMTMREAFSRSINVFFGKLGLLYVGPQDLLEYAERFKFNQPIPADVPVEIGYAKIPSDDPWALVEASSGYTRENTMSPVHGAMIAATVANDGVMMEPFLIEHLSSPSGEMLYQAEAKQTAAPIDADTASEVRVLMRETIRSGTSRKAFRHVVRERSYSDVEFGGKTGSLMGVNPAGKTDWFIGYVRYKEHRLAVAAVTVHGRLWRVKSSQLASDYMNAYVRTLKSEERMTAQNSHR